MAAFDPARQASSPVVRLGLRVAGALLVAVGLLGIFLPLLPTTIFLLGAAACFGKSSPGAYRWLTTNRWFGRYLRNYREERGATLTTKCSSIAALWLGIGGATYLVRSEAWLAAVLVLVAMAVTVHVLALRTVPE